MIPVNAPGFAGPKNLGNKLGAEALLDHVIGTMEPEHRTSTDINIIGEYNLAGFCVGVVEAGESWDGSTIEPGHVALGLASLADAHGRWRLADSRRLGSNVLEVYERIPCSPE